MRHAKLGQLFQHFMNWNDVVAIVKRDIGEGQINRFLEEHVHSLILVEILLF